MSHNKQPKLGFINTSSYTLQTDIYACARLQTLLNKGRNLILSNYSAVALLF